ncbi:MAG: CoB--CoM heterodisulfide reductase iron-sulfur subunit B family protein [Crenarchaeota archaeon]|nr:CoB--CoM heterodisulfide reductase iron-sulfur subunit B family protein [Thermoproteota archaeon]MCR8455437.1 CoB--CoM heterodisulfide reductase iron-sulfur subunit B family protein [Thermoproteota archaeon]MCR8501450.1 CoB--CoM heterodisulfide reductase iron-sulfur subunit B family protein [Thermoproteota archaeon]
MTYILYQGCAVWTSQYQYEISARKILDFFGIDYIDFPEQQCCGKPLACVNMNTWLVLAARIMAIAEREGRDIITLCNGCYLSLNEAKKIIMESHDEFSLINSILSKENLKFTGFVKIKHIVKVISEDIGLKRIIENSRLKLDGLKLAIHYGCHVLRPKEFSVDKNPEDPSIIEDILSSLGASCPYYSEKFDCCMALLANVDVENADLIRGKKLLAIKRRGFDALVTICPLCQQSYELRQKKISRVLKEDISIPVIYLTQLLGLSLGLHPRDLGLHLNESPVEKIIKRLGYESL